VALPELTVDPPVPILGSPELTADSPELTFDVGASETSLTLTGPELSIDGLVKSNVLIAIHPLPKIRATRSVISATDLRFENRDFKLFIAVMRSSVREGAAQATSLIHMEPMAKRYSDDTCEVLCSGCLGSHGEDVFFGWAPRTVRSDTAQFYSVRSIREDAGR
jgi:hypothetical protein